MASASAGWAWMADVAGEELAKLEAAHPGRFGPLKAELQRLVAEPGLDAAAFPPLASPPSPASPRADNPTTAVRSSSQPAPPSPAGPLATQESSSRKRRLEGGGARGREEGGRRRRRVRAAPSEGKKKDRADMAIERAHRCLERIRAIKQSLLAAWIH